jgi:hypothetical protein
MDKRLKDIIAYRCNDTDYYDFPESVYNEGMLFSAREVARRHSILHRYYSFTITTNDPLEYQKPVPIRLHSFTAEELVRVNGIELTRSDNIRFHDNTNMYQLYYGVDGYLFNYTPRTPQDIIEIYYTADITVDDYDEESITPVIPQRYNEEIIRGALLYISELGIAKFKEAKNEKYMKIYKLNQNKRVGTETGEKKTWPTLKPFKII